VDDLEVRREEGGEVTGLEVERVLGVTDIGHPFSTHGRRAQILRCLDGQGFAGAGRYRRVKTASLRYREGVVIENPFVTRDALREALDPSGRSPATAVRRLREAGLISHGIELRPHQGGRLRGGAVYYCALNLDAAEAVRDGDETTARKFARAAASVEANKTIRSLAKALAEVRDLRELPAEQRRTASTVAARIMRTRNRLAHGVNPMVGVVVDADDRFGTVQTDSETIVLPRTTLRARGLDRLGAAVAIRAHSLRTGAMLHYVDEALALDDDDRRGARPFDPFAMRAERSEMRSERLVEEALAGREPVRLLAPVALAR